MELLIYGCVYMIPKAKNNLLQKNIYIKLVIQMKKVDTGLYNNDIAVWQAVNSSNMSCNIFHWSF